MYRRAMWRWVVTGWVVLVVACAPQSQPQQQPEPQPAPRVPSAGDPLELRVRVTKPDGRPAANTTVRLYHTDAAGYYLRNADGSEAGSEHARLSFTTTTDADGRFTLTTIVPARYPVGGPPAHVHLHIPPDHPDDLTIMLDSDPTLDRAYIAKMARTWIGRVQIEGSRAVCDADIVAP